MTTLDLQRGDPLADGGPRFVHIGPDLLAPALAHLLGGDTGRGQPTVVDEFIRSARDEGTDLSFIWAMLGPSRAAGPVPASAKAAAKGPQPRILDVAMAVPAAGRTAMMFISPAPNPAADPGAVALLPTIEQRGRLVNTVLAALRAANVPGSASASAGGELHLAQALLEADEQEQAAAMVAGGFVRLAELAYMRRPLPKRPRSRPLVLPEGLVALPMSDLPPAKARAMVLAAMEASYVDTLDCPALCGMREGEDVLESHEAVGEHDPRLWWLVFAGNMPVGCMLLSPCTKQDAVELVYLGLGPAARGRGVGAALLAHADLILAGRRERYLACAVDTLNTPALRLYERAGFERFARRTALVADLRTHAS